MRISDWSSDVCSSDLAAVTTIASSPPATSAGAASCAKAGEESALQASAARAKLRFMITPVSKRALVRPILKSKGLCGGETGWAAGRERVCLTAKTLGCAVLFYKSAHNPLKYDRYVEQTSPT